MFRCQTTYREKVIEKDLADYVYNYLKDEIAWESGIPSRKGPTRLAKALFPGENELVDQVVSAALKEIGSKYKYFMRGIYLNYYANGDMWTPNHNHPGTHQLVVSLGGTRCLQVAKKNYFMSNGSAIIFGSATHGVPKDPQAEGRISIAVFLEPVK